MKLQANKSYRTRDGKNIITVKRVQNGTNYIFADINNVGDTYLECGHSITATLESDEDLVELI
jgi:hypothetical protein